MSHLASYLFDFPTWISCYFKVFSQVDYLDSIVWAKAHEKNNMYNNRVAFFQ